MPKGAAKRSSFQIRMTSPGRPVQEFAELRAVGPDPAGFVHEEPVEPGLLEGIELKIRVLVVVLTLA